MRKAAVAVVQCSEYNCEHVEHAVTQAVALVPEIVSILTNDSHVLLKVDLEKAGGRETGPYIHASVVKAAATAISGLGARLTIGDGSKGIAWPMWRKIRRLIFSRLKDRMKGRSYDEVLSVYKKIKSIKTFRDIASLSVEGIDDSAISPADLAMDNDTGLYAVTGIEEVAQAVGAGLSNFELESYEERRCTAQKFLSHAMICRAACESSAIVSMPKIRPDEDVGFYGAVRNMLSIVPTAVRHMFLTVSRLSDVVGEMCIDVMSTVQTPVCAISDNIEGLAGKNGPRFVAVGSDCVAHDAVVAHMTGCNPMDIACIRAGHEAGLGQGLLQNIDIREAAV
jgi:uncharacterized protein (DUF362 family)